MRQVRTGLYELHVSVEVNISRLEILTIWSVPISFSPRLQTCVNFSQSVKLRKCYICPSRYICTTTPANIFLLTRWLTNCRIVDAVVVFQNRRSPVAAYSYFLVHTGRKGNLCIIFHVHIIFKTLFSKQNFVERSLSAIAVGAPEYGKSFRRRSVSLRERGQTCAPSEG